MVYDPVDYGPAKNISVDSDSDGTFEQSLPPTSDLGPEDGSDFKAPVIKIDLNGQIGPEGWYIGEVDVSITATDEQSGVAKIKYSPDFGGSIIDYSGPFTVQANQVSLLIAQAMDRAGNEGVTTVKVGPRMISIPLVLASRYSGD
jgi:hypothetical protein